MDKFTVEILKDGTFKIETDAISDAAHVSAEDLLRELFRLAGGESTIEFKDPLHVKEQGHSHGHGHGHSHSH